jgi:hypothetical protein
VVAHDDRPERPPRRNEQRRHIHEGPGSPPAMMPPDDENERQG